MSYLLVDYQCQDCGAVEESLEDRPAREIIPCADCAGEAHRQLGAPHVGTVWCYAVSRGKEDPKPPGALDTRQLAEGMPRKEWEAPRKKRRRDERIAQIRKDLG